MYLNKSIVVICSHYQACFMLFVPFLSFYLAFYTILNPYLLWNFLSSSFFDNIFCYVEIIGMFVFIIDLIDLFEVVILEFKHNLPPPPPPKKKRNNLFGVLISYVLNHSPNCGHSEKAGWRKNLK